VAADRKKAEGCGIIHVSDIASLAWCQCKALAVLNGDYEPPETDEMAKGRQIHEQLGFNNQQAYRMPFGDFILEGTPDKVGDFYIAELKVTRGRYPLNYLLAYAHVQANLYAMLADKPLYVVVVYNVETGEKMYFPEKADVFRAQRDLALAYALMSGVLKPIPTREPWKCRSCGYTKCVFRLAEYEAGK